MFSSTSRYAAIPDLEQVDADGRVVRYKARRFLPQAERLATRGEVTVRQSDRLDLVTARTLGRPELFWRLADANDAMDPFALVRRPNRRLRVPVPHVEGALPPT